MQVNCRRCNEYRQSYVRNLCKLCYDALKKQEKRGSVLFDRELLYPLECSVPGCAGFASGKPGLAMCEEHHDYYYHHVDGTFKDFNCTCGAQSGCESDEK
jgi:hypothetical protein